MTAVLEDIALKTWFDRLLDGTLSFEDLPVAQGERVRVTFLGNDPSSQVTEEPRIHCLLTPYGKRLENWGEDDSWLYLVVGPNTLFAHQVDEGKLHKKGDPQYILSEERINHRTKKRILPFEAPSGFPEKIVSDSLSKSVRTDVEHEWRLQAFNRFYGTFFVKNLYNLLLDRKPLPENETDKDLAIRYFTALDAALASRTRLYDTISDLFCDDFDSTRPVRRRSLRGIDFIRPQLVIETDKFSTIFNETIDQVSDMYFECAGARFKDMPGYDLMTDELHLRSVAQRLGGNVDSTMRTMKRRLSVHCLVSSLFRATVNFTALALPSGVASLLFGAESMSHDILETAALAAIGADTGVQFINGLWSYARCGITYTPGIPATLREMRSPDNIYRA